MNAILPLNRKREKEILQFSIFDIKCGATSESSHVMMMMM